jgi:thiosulfate/3-mercaptopyruvate sulfurtransferase
LKKEYSNDTTVVFYGDKNNWWAAYALWVFNLFGHELVKIKDEIIEHIKKGGILIDVRSPKESTGELIHMPDYPQEGALRGGHIPTAINIP